MDTKKIKIGFVTETFLSWNGGFDFINHLIFSLDSVAKKNNLDIYICIPYKLSIFQKLKKEISKLLKDFSKDIIINGRYRHLKPFLKEYIGYIKDIIKNNFDYIKKYPEYQNMKKIIDLHSNCSILNYNPQEIYSIFSSFDCILPIFNNETLSLSLPMIAYLPDCQHRHLPHFFSQEDIQLRDIDFQTKINTNKPMIVNADTVKKDLIHFYNAKEEHIHVLPFTPKINKNYFSNKSNIIKKYKLSKHYFLISNQFWIHKDHITPIRAFAELLKNSKHTDIELICTGSIKDYRSPDYIKSIYKLIDDLQIQNKVKFLGLIPKREQIEIMKNSIAVLQPTLFEGGPGGGSVWDAIALGVPCIVSDIETNLEIQNEDLVSFFKTGDDLDLYKKMKYSIQQPRKIYSKEELIAKNNKNIRVLADFLVSLIHKYKQ